MAVLVEIHEAFLGHDTGFGHPERPARLEAVRAGLQWSGVEDDIVSCFRSGGGVPYSRFPKFQELMAEMSAEVHDAALIGGELALVDGLIDRLREGIDRRRRSQSGLSRLLARLLGMDMKLRQYEQGKRFCDAIVAEAGVEALHHVFSGPEALPTLDELSDPPSWLQRVAAAV